MSESEDIYKKAFWDLFHINAEIMLCLSAKSDDKRRKIDGWIQNKSEQVDALMLRLPKEE